LPEQHTQFPDFPIDALCIQLIDKRALPAVEAMLEKNPAPVGKSRMATGRRVRRTGFGHA
jgi:hypothetical protein